MLDEYEHWRLFSRSREGDSLAATEFERHWSNAVHAFLGRGFTREQVDELSGQFFERVYAKAASFEWTMPFTVYLRTILLNISRDELRRLIRRRQRVVSWEDCTPQPEATCSPEPSPEQRLLDDEARGAVRAALAKLTPTERHIVIGALVEGRSGQELADTLGIRRNAFYQRLHRAKRRLGDLLEAASAEEQKKRRNPGGSR